MQRVLSWANLKRLLKILISFGKKINNEMLLSSSLLSEPAGSSSSCNDLSTYYWEGPWKMQSVFIINLCEICKLSINSK